MNFLNPVVNWFSKVRNLQTTPVDQSLTELVKRLDQLHKLIDERFPASIAENLKFLSCSKVQSSEIRPEDLQSRLTQLELQVSRMDADLQRVIAEGANRHPDLRKPLSEIRESSQKIEDALRSQAPSVLAHSNLSREPPYHPSSMADLERFIIQAWTNVRKTGFFTVEAFRSMFASQKQVQILHNSSLISVSCKIDNEITEYLLPDPNVSVETHLVYYNIGNQMTASSSNYVIQKVAFRRNGSITKGILSAP